MVGNAVRLPTRRWRRPVLAFNLGAMPGVASRAALPRARGRGRQQGDGVNRARAMPAACRPVAWMPNRLRAAAGGTRGHQRRPTACGGGGVFATDACVLGKVFVDCNGNHVQDAEELGIPGVRLVMQDGTT
jgi:hypothetical protein